MAVVKKLYRRYENVPIQARASLWFLICSFLAKGISAMTTPIFTRIMSTEEYGKYGVFNSWYSILFPFITLNMFGGVYVNGLVKFEKDRGRYMSSLQGLCICLAIGWTGFYLVFHNFINDLLGLDMIQMTCLILLAWEESVFNAWSVQQRTVLKYTKLVVLAIIVSITRPLMGILLVSKYNGLATARIIGSTMVDVCAYTGLFIAIMARGKTFCDTRYWKYTIKHNIPLIPHYLSMTILSSSDRIMISKLVNDSSAGIYNLAYQLAMIMYFFHSALMQTIEPWIYRKLKEKGMKEISYLLNIAATGMAIVLVGAIAVSPELLRLFAPPQYYEALYVIPPIIMSVFFIFLYVFFATYEFHNEKTHFIATASCIGAILNIVLNYYFIKAFGYRAAGYTTLICYMVFAIAHYMFSRFIWVENNGDECMYNTKFIIMLTIVFLVAGFILMATYKNSIIRYSLIFLMICVLIIKRGIIRNYLELIANTRKVKE